MRDVGDCRQATGFSRTPGLLNVVKGNNRMDSGSEGSESEQE